MSTTYKEFINNILETRGRFICGDEYYERHHITPKCMSGENEETNLIDLYAKEHFEAHKLLALENPDNEKLQFAWWNMAHTNKSKQRDYEITAQEYEDARIAFSKVMSGRTMSEEVRKRMSENHADVSGENNPMYGRKHTEEERKKMSESIKGKMAGDKHPRACKIAQYTIDWHLIKVWDYAKLAAETLNIDLSAIIKCCKGKKYKTVGGYRWLYVDD